MQQNQALGRQPEELLIPLVNNESLDVLIQQHVDKNEISWGGVGGKEQETLIFKFYIPIPIPMLYKIYDYLLKIGYGADRLFTEFEGISQMLKDNMAYNKKLNRT
ncbi:hypothetical protein ACFRAM_15905 [Paenibacillus sp. NPDC056722]|uniref:hypothetical protein n=1 Tax=Paenibacillus sp. NPDC056722 TaxID=3345924 RepID=UPI0036820AE8